MSLKDQREESELTQMKMEIQDGLTLVFVFCFYRTDYSGTVSLLKLNIPARKTKGSSYPQETHGLASESRHGERVFTFGAFNPAGPGGLAASSARQPGQEGRRLMSLSLRLFSLRLRTETTHSPREEWTSKRSLGGRSSPCCINAGSGSRRPAPGALSVDGVLTCRGLCAPCTSGQGVCTSARVQRGRDGMNPAHTGCRAWGTARLSWFNLLFVLK